MSAPLKLTADQLRNLGRALDVLTSVRIDHGVSVTAYGSVDVMIDDDCAVAIGWDDDVQQYVIDDQVGS